MATITLSKFSKPPPTGPSRLSKILNHLNQQPRLQLKDVMNLRIQWGVEGTSKDIKRFMRKTLPRIRYANPVMPIEANKVWNERVDSSIELTFGSGKTQTIKMDELSSGAILKQLMEAAGGDAWAEFERKQKTEGLHISRKVPNSEKKPATPFIPTKLTGSASSQKARASAS